MKIDPDNILMAGVTNLNQLKYNKIARATEERIKMNFMGL